MLWTANALANGQNIYSLPGLHSEPWLITIYPPLYLVLAAGLVKTFGAQYFCLRLANMLFCAGTLFFMYKIMKQCGCRLTSILCSLVFLFSFDTISFQSYEARPDYLLIFLSAFMLERFVSLELKVPKPDTLRSYLSVLGLGCLSIGVKQQAIVFVLSIVIYLALDGRVKLAGKIFVVWLLVLALFTGVIQLICGGYIESLTFLSVVKSDSTVLISNLANIGIDWIKLSWALLIVPCGILAMKKLEGLKRFPFILVIVSTLLFLYSMGIPASNSNHLMSALLGLSWVLAFCLDSLFWGTALILLVCSATSFPHLAEEARFRPLLLPHANKSAAVLQQLDLKGKPVLTDDLYLNVLTESTPVLIDCASFLNAWKAQGSDFSQITKPLAEHRYAAVLINSQDAELPKKPNFWPKEIVEAIQKNYRKVDELHCSAWPIDLYLPNTTAAHPN